MSVIIDDYEFPECCDKCWALDDCGDNPSCRITGDSKGYTFNTRAYRMETCPLTDCVVDDLSNVKDTDAIKRVISIALNSYPEYVKEEIFSGIDNIPSCDIHALYSIYYDNLRNKENKYDDKTI